MRERVETMPDAVQAKELEGRITPDETKAKEFATEAKRNAV